jgi:hypothetical protein
VHKKAVKPAVPGMHRKTSSTVTRIPMPAEFRSQQCRQCIDVTIATSVNNSNGTGKLFCNAVLHAAKVNAFTSLSKRDLFASRSKRRRLIIRAAVMAASKEWLFEAGRPQLIAMVCQIEKNLVPLLLQSPYFGELPNYVLYTTNLSNSVVENALQKFMGRDYEDRVKLVNLDLDTDNYRLEAFTPGKNVTVLGKAQTLPKLDTLSRLCLRRDLADIFYLPPDQPRLLIGTDVSFVRPAFGFVEAAVKLADNQVLYLWDSLTFGGTPYRLRNWTGPQCPGLLGDFYYLSPGEPLSFESFVNKTWWYLSQPVTGKRLLPYFHDPSNLPYHAIDQWVLAMFLGEWAQPPEQGCFRLNPTYYRSYPLAPFPICFEAVHDKNIRNAGCEELSTEFEMSV